MVKRLDEKIARETGDLPLDHIGIRLWDANRLWVMLFRRAMVDAGHTWFGPAQANLLGHLDRDGTPQTVLVQRMGLSKQAVQQVVDDLERRGVLRRDPDPEDRRARIISFTDRGAIALQDADAIKLALEARFEAVLGKRDLANLRRVLAKLLASDMARS